MQVKYYFGNKNSKRCDLYYFEISATNNNNTNYFKPRPADLKFLKLLGKRRIQKYECIPVCIINDAEVLRN